VSFFGELRRRNVVKVAVAYGILSWLLIEIASVMGPALNLPDWITSSVAFFLILGFPVAMLLAWAYELTPEGVKKTKSVPLSDSITKVTGRKLDFAIILALILVLGFVVVDNYVLVDSDQETVVQEPAAVEPAAEIPAPVIVEEEREVLPNSVAVLLCDNLSPDPNDAYFAAGIHEEILNQLVKLRNLTVISRTSVLQYADAPPPIPQIAAELNVRAVMECSVRYAGDGILVTAQLIDPETDSHLWSDTYPGDLSDLSTIFAMQADIAMNIANALEAEFSADEQESIEAVPTESLAAYSFYLRGLSSDGSVTGINRSIEDLTEAITRDPNFAIAYAQRAWMYVSGLVYSLQVPVSELEPAAVDDAEHALRLDSTLGLAHSVLASIDALNRRWADARRRVELAYELSPNDVAVLAQYVRITRDAGEYPESLRATERWAQLEPNNAALYQQLTVGHRYARNYAAAATAARRAIELDPSLGSLHVHLAYAEAVLGNRDVAMRELQIAERIFDGDYDQSFRVGQMAMAYAQVDRRDDVERMAQLLADLDQEIEVGAAVWAQVHVALGDFDEAYRRLEAAMAGPSALNNTTLSELKANSTLIPELDEPRFQELLGGFWDVE